MLDSTSSPRVAVIDDDLGFAQSAAALLQSDGYAVDLYGSAETFLAGEHRPNYCCLLVDWGLPGMKGTALCQRLLADDAQARMILMSGARLNCQGDKPVPGVEFFEKPFDPDRLLAEISQDCGCAASR